MPPQISDAEPHARTDASPSSRPASAVSFPQAAGHETDLAASLTAEGHDGTAGGDGDRGVPSNPTARDLGWSERWQAYLAVAQLNTGEEALRLGRVSVVHRGALEILTLAPGASGPDAALETLSVDLRLPGHAEDEFDWPPVVGDWVALDEQGRIRAILQRSSFLERAHNEPGQGAQALAANVDVLLMVEPMSPPPAVGRIERLTAVARSAGCQAWLVLTKADLTSPEEVAAALAELERGTDAAFAVSMEGPASIASLREALPTGTTAVLLGRSGAGKSTLSNALMGSDLATGAVRAGDGKGRHTTTSRQLIAQGGLTIIDTPGIRALAAVDDVAAIEETFEDISALARHCAYRNCAHQTEPGCAVREAIERAELNAERVGRYLRMRAELAQRHRHSDPRVKREEERRASKNDSRGRRGVMRLKGKL